MAGIAAGVREDGSGSAVGRAPPGLEAPQAVVDEVNTLRRDPRGYAEGLAQLDCGGALQDCLHDLRSAAPMPELTLSQAMCQTCQLHLADLAAKGQCSHIGTDGSTPEVRLSRAGDHREQCGENMAFGAGSATDCVHQMLLDNASAEHSQRANLLNPDFRFAGVAQGAHPSGGTAAILLLADHFRAKQASQADAKREVLVDVLGPEAQMTKDALEGGDDATQRSWDELMQRAKPSHLRVPPKQRAHVEFMANPKLYGPERGRAPLVPVGDLQPRPSVDPAMVRAFLHRVDSDHDDLITEQDLEALCCRKQLNITQAEIGQMFDEILQRRQARDQDRRSVDYAEVCAAMQPQKNWVPVMDVHVERGADAYQLIVDPMALARWSRELHAEFAERCEGLEPPPSRSEGSRSRNRGAGVRVERMNTFLASVLTARVADAGLLQQEPQVTGFLGRPGHGPDPASGLEEFKRALCLGQRRLWAYRLRPHREAWLRMFRVLGVQPLVPLATGGKRPVEQAAGAQGGGGGGSSGSAPSAGFEAKRKSAQAERQFNDESDALAREVNSLTKSLGMGTLGHGGTSPGLTGTASRRGFGASAPPLGNRGHGAGSHSLMAHSGVRGHFHNSASIRSGDIGQSGLSTLDVRWEGSHIDHTKLAPHKADAKCSTMAPEERSRQFSTYFKGSLLDRAALKVQTASNHARDAQPYKDWTQHEFRADVPHRHGQHGRRHFDAQVREKSIGNRHFISELENKPQEEIERHSERVNDTLQRSLPKGQERHFQLYLPPSQQPSKYQELASHQPVRSTNTDGVVKRHALGFGQLRHSGPGDPDLYTRPLGASHMDRLLPLAA